MSGLTKEENEIILDFYFQCGGKEVADRAAELIAKSQQARAFYVQLQQTIGTLDYMTCRSCPESLVEKTITNLKQTAMSGERGLRNLLFAEQAGRGHADRSLRSSFWRNLVEVAVVAAAIVLITGVGFPTLSNMRQQSWQADCQHKMEDIGSGIVRYAEDNDDMLPSVAMTSGAPWWKVGHQGDENESNTRNPWLLIKEGYVEPEDFICPGHRDAIAFDTDPSLMEGYSDFPSRRNVSYSFRAFCDKAGSVEHKRMIMLADMNPIFADLPDGSKCYELDEFTKIWVNEQLKKIMSPNHRGRGQSVLYCDGSVDFSKNRFMEDDDIYTIQGVDCYSGREFPLDEYDVFLAP